MRFALYFTSFIFSLIFVGTYSVAEKNESVILSRKRRYLVFPEGASLAVSVCTQQQLIGPSFLTEAEAFGIAYDLPNDTSLYKDYLFPKFLHKKRHRRELYRNIEALIDSMGYDGRSCIFRALCEASQRYFSSAGDILEKILSIVFSFPYRKVLHSEPQEHHLYHQAYKVGKENQERECGEIFPQCSFSLIDMALGDYSAFG